MDHKLNQIAKVVAASNELLVKRPQNIGKSDLIALLEQFVELLGNDCHHLRIDHFCYLPNEIIHAILKTAQYEKGISGDLERIAKINGSWAEFGKLALVKPTFSFTEVYNQTDFGKLEAKAPQLYEFIKFHDIPLEAYETLELMENRFSTVIWYDRKCANNSPSREVINFLKRQLESQYLRTMIIEGNLRTDEFNELFADFVKRPQFEELRFHSVSRIPFEVFVEAHKAYKATEYFEVRRKHISTVTSVETKNKMKNYIGTRVFPDSLTVRDHPTHGSAKMKLMTCDGMFSMTFVNLQS